jgi:hypothetical protein
MKNRSPLRSLVAAAVSLSVCLGAARGEGFPWFGKGGSAGEPAEPSPVISPIPPGDPEAHKNGGGGWFGRLRERQKAEAPASPIPMQQGLIGETTGSDRKSTASESKPKPKPQPKPAPVEPPKPPVKSRSPVKTPSSGPIGETFAWEVPLPPASPAKGATGKKTEIDLDRPRLVMRQAGAAQFVALRDGIWEGGLKPRTVLRFLDRYTGDVVRARTAGGVEILLKTWQVRDATFDEAVNFMEAEGF